MPEPMQKLLPKFETGLFWLVLFLIVFIPLYPKFPLMGVKGTFVTIRIEDLAIFITAALWLIYLFVSKRVTIAFKDTLNQTLLLFFFIGAVSLFAGIFLTHTVTPHLGLLHYLRRIEFMVLLPVAAMVIKTRKQLNICLALLFLVALFAGIYALGQQYLHWPVISTSNSEFSKGLILYLTPDARVSSTFAGHYDLAVFLVMIITLLGALFFLLRKPLLVAGSVVIGILSGVVLVMTAARWSFVAGLFGVAASLVLTGKKILVIPMFIAAVVLLAYPSQLRDRFVSTITVNLLKEGSRYEAETKQQQERSRLNIPTLPHESSTDSAEMVRQPGVPSDITPGEPTDYVDMGVYRSFGIRFDVEWPRAIRAFIKNPFLGTGYSSLGLATDNDFLRILGEVGLLGTLSFVLVFAAVFKRLWRRYRRADKFGRYFSAGVISVTLAFLLNAVFIDVFEASKIASIFWILLGLGLAKTGDENN